MKTPRKKNGHMHSSDYRYYVRLLSRHKKELSDRYNVKEIGIFGSYIRGEQRAKSDIDILVDFYEIPDLRTFMGLAEELESLLQKKVDLVRKPVIRKELREHVLSEVVYV